MTPDNRGPRYLSPLRPLQIYAGFPEPRLDTRHRTIHKLHSSFQAIHTRETAAKKIGPVLQTPNHEE